MVGTSMTPEELEVAYDQSRWAANMGDVLARYSVISDAMRLVAGQPTRLSYGPASEEMLDLYKASEAFAPIVVFVHGGGWRGGSAREYGFPAEMMMAAGIYFIALDFATIADAKGDLAILVGQVRRALGWIYQNCSRFDGDPTRIYIVGHSSGAHLAAMALSTRWGDYGLSANPIRGGVLVSGVYDLGPLQHTSRSQYVYIDDRIERQLSPLHQIANLSAPLLLVVGSKESPEFQRQTLSYADAASASARQIKVVTAETYHHFDIVETLGNPYGLLGRNLLDFVATGYV